VGRETVGKILTFWLLYYLYVRPALALISVLLLLLRYCGTSEPLYLYGYGAVFLDLERLESCQTMSA
jgi:hypothetical protein